MMDTGWRYRAASVVGVAVLTAAGTFVVNNAAVQSVATAVPILARLPTDPPTGVEVSLEILLAVAVVAGAFVPLYKPRPRRILDVVALTHKRVLVAVFALATIGYFDYTYRLPRLTLLLLAPILFVVLPLWFIWLRQPETGVERAVVVGDDVDTIKQVVDAVDTPLVGCLCPTTALVADGSDRSARVVADGGTGTGAELDRLGGLSRIEDVLVEYDIDTAVLAFAEADRAEFFGALDACYEHGVDATVHREHADTVLTAEGTAGPLVDVEIEPWDVQDYLLKRAFDVAFSLAGLVALSPVIAVIATAIKREDGGSILYSQERTAVFGETFDVYKFRSMVENAEANAGAKISEEDEGGVDPRVTRVGRVLRQTHLDEIPQLWSVLRGDMSVVGPRPERPELDSDIKTGVVDWHKRWFVKPGLTGLAQINDVTGAEPEAKLRYDLLYVREQSFSYDIKVVARQIWKVGADVLETVGNRDEDSE